MGCIKKKHLTHSGNILSFSEAPASGNLEVIPLSAAPIAPTGSWSPQAPIPNATAGTEVNTINSNSLLLMQTGGSYK